MILFVCTGNTCRSPLAAALVRARGIQAESAGIAACPGAPATPQAVRAAARRGEDLTGHRAQPVTGQLMAQADAVYAMTDAHGDLLRARFPAFADKVRVLSPQISDPYGGDDGVYDLCAEELLCALERAGVLPPPFQNGESLI